MPNCLTHTLKLLINYEVTLLNNIDPLNIHFIASFINLRGNLIWKSMENKNIIPGRSWQSLKQRFNILLLFLHFNIFTAFVFVSSKSCD